MTRRSPENGLWPCQELSARLNANSVPSVGGRLRLLRSADNLDDAIMEVPPAEGTLLAFKRADNSWHGHKPFAGERRVIQFNWVTSEGDRRLAMLRHHVSAPFKRLIAAMRPTAA